MTPDTSLILKGLTPLVKPTASWLGKRIIGAEILERRQLEATALDPVLQKAAVEIAEIIEQIGVAKIEQICLFLTSNEAEAIIRQIYAASILDSKEQNLAQIKQEFLTAFSLYTNISELELADSAPHIFNTLVTGCETTLQVAIDQGRLSAHEAKSVFRHQILLDELASVKKNLEFLTASQLLDIPAILKFEDDYRRQIAELHGKLTPPYIDVSKKLPIDQLYVSPNFSPEILNRDSREKSQTQSDFYLSIYRTVLLGNPGGGKSTCTQKLCFDLVNQYSERLLGGRQVTPILVILRDYGARKKENPCSLLEFIELTAKSKYQLQSPVGAFEYLLLNGRVSVIFDGLDELTETSYRQDIRNDVELFCNLYPAVPVLVTSREVGYKEAPLDESKFEVHRLAPFEDSQVSAYVTKWFAIDKELTKEQQSEKVKAFLIESENLTDLRSNPLMLGLMCNIYKGEGYIPRNRPAVYAKCAEMLFERWDRGRDIKLPFLVREIESKIKPLMMYLANWIYTDESLQSGVTETILIAKAADYLCEKRFEDRDDAEGAAKAFIRFCRGRAWVFTNVGTNKYDQELYKFTHRTFLEYFTAAYLNRIHRTPDQLFDVLLPRIAKQEWDVVSQLAFQIQNTKFEDAGDELLTCLLENIESYDSDEKWNLILFAVTTLEFIIPSPKIVKSIIYIVIEESIKFGLSRFEDDNQNNVYNLENKKLPINSIVSLQKAAAENTKNIASNIEQFIINKIESFNYKELALLLEIISLLERSIELNDILEYLKINYSNKIKEAIRYDVLTCTLYKNLFDIPISDMIKWHGFENIFKSYHYRLNYNIQFTSPLSDILDCLFFSRGNYDQEQEKLFIDDILYLEKILITHKFPITIENNIDIDNLNHIFDSYMISKSLNKNFANLVKEQPNILFGGYIIFAILLEIELDDDFSNSLVYEGYGK